MKGLLWTLKILCVAVILFGGLQIYRIYAEKGDVAQAFEGLKEQVTEPEPSETEESPTETVDTGNIRHFNEKFRSLYDQNSDIVGWLTVEGTGIDYPVMQTSDAYYLTHSFERNYSRHGTPFLAAACDVLDSDNLIVNGHNMRDGTMFSQLTRFTEPDFCAAGGTITFDTIWSDHSWRPACVFLISAEQAAEFPYHTISSFSDETMSRADYLAACSRFAIWQDTEAMAAEGRLLTLSTCEYSQQDGRLVVVAVETETE